jgi:hypothetical protein
MKIIFAGQTIADDYDVTGDAVSRVAISGTQSNQIAEFLRGVWKQPMARGNRSHTLPFHHIRPPASAPSAAFLEMILWFSNLPQSGELQLIEGGTTITFATAVMENFKSSRSGVTWSYDAEFVCGMPTGIASSDLLLMSGGYLRMVNGNAIALQN